MSMTLLGGGEDGGERKCRMRPMSLQGTTRMVGGNLHRPAPAEAKRHD
jgi:hypothetical protein